MVEPSNIQGVGENTPATRFRRPDLGAVVLRERLFCELDVKREHCAVWISGPAGSGKTTLVSSYLRERGVPYVWCQLDESDADIASFFISLNASFRTAFPDCEEALPAFGLEHLAGLPVFAQAYFRKLFKLMAPHSVLVLDDYHTVRLSSRLHEVVRVAVDEAPSHVSIVVASREDPPAEYSGLVASGSVHLVERNALRFTISEAERIFSLLEPGGQEETWLREASDLTGGWVAGLILMLRAAQQGAGHGGLKGAQYNNDAIFGYFAAELFRNMAPPMRSFLLRTAYLPVMTTRMADDLTGAGNAAEILADLHRKNFFTERIESTQVYYSFHSLFRSFLLHEAARQLPVEELEVIRYRAAGLLEKGGFLHDAFDLVQQSRDWEQVVRIVLSAAPTLVAQGQYETLQRWLEVVPQESVLRQNPYLLFWDGICRLPFHQGAARGSLEQALSMFEDRNDLVGMLMAWPAIIETFMFEWSDCHPMDRWIRWVERALPEGVTFPDGEAEARVALGVFNALMVRQPQHPMLPVWVERLERLVPRISDPTQQVLISARLAQYCTITGEFSRGERLLQSVERAVIQQQASPLAVVNWYAIKVIYGWLKADWQKFHEWVSDAARVSRETGVYVMDFFVNVQAAFGSLTSGDTDAAEEHVARAQETLIPSRLLDVMMLHLVTAWLNLQKKEYALAREHAEAALDCAQTGGLPFGEVLAYMAKSQAESASATVAEASDTLRSAWRVAKLVKSDHLVCAILFLNAHYAYLEGRETDGDEALVNALAIAKKERYVNFPGWQQDVMAYLCQKALQLEVEIKYVRKLIHARGLTPVHVSEATEHWPWPVRIHALGPFRLTVDGEEVSFAHKPKKKPLELLKLVVALGGESVPETRIADELWPDSDGDQARQALSVTLHRLRQLFGGHKPLRVTDGAVFLDRNLVWVDTWDFDAWIDAALEDGPAGSQERKIHALSRAVDLYRGPLLPLEADRPWSVGSRERYARKFVRAVSELGDALIALGRLGDAAAVYERAHALEPEADEIFDRLSACQNALGRTVEARQVYARQNPSNSSS